MRRARVGALPGDGASCLLDDAVVHHLTRVLRLAPGAPVLLFDGQGGEADATLDAGSPPRSATQHGPARHAAPAPPVHLLLAVVKGPAMDLAVRMATEAGATSIHPVFTERSVARGDRGDRWQRIAGAAAAQCRRADVPTVLPAVSLDAALARVAAVTTRLVAHPGSPPVSPADGECAVLVGPEGGLTDAEVAQCTRAGWRTASIARHVLRADTAAAVAVARLTGC